MKNRFLSLLEERTLLFDGAMGTLLIEKGMPPGQCSEQWNLDAPEIVAEIHRTYFEAGADLVQTNSFGGNRIKLEGAGLDDRVLEINRKAAEIARSVSPSRGLVVGDMGPTGKLIKPYGDLEPSVLETVFAEQAEALLAGGVDLLHIETMFDLGELLAALRGARSVTDGPIIASMTFQTNPRGYFTLMGVSPADFVKEATAMGADVIGTNCTLSPKEMVPLVEELGRVTEKPIMAKPNAGNPVLREGRTEYLEGPEAFASGLHALVGAGARLVGGCCGTTPDSISAAVGRILPGRDRR